MHSLASRLVRLAVLVAGGCSVPAADDASVALDAVAQTDHALDVASAVERPVGMEAASDAAALLGDGSVDDAPDVASDAPVAGDATSSALLPVPDSLLHTLAATPYVEQHCVATTYPGWPYEAQRCTYGNNLVVTVADPSAMRVARWIVDAAEHIAVVAALRPRDAASYEACLVRIARHTMDQSSRIFPLEGEISEDVVYAFLHGVTYGYPDRTRLCSSCYCRIDSLTRSNWCDYRSAVHAADRSACLSQYGGDTGWNDAWATHCMANHQAAWLSDSNEHYLAQAWAANRGLAMHFPDPPTARGPDVVTALSSYYPTYCLGSYYLTY